MFGVSWLAALDRQLEVELERPLYTLPTSLYARPLELAQGADITRLDLVGHLQRTGYRELVYEGMAGPVSSGEFSRAGRTWRIGRRHFPTPDGALAIGGPLRIELDSRGRVRRLHDADGKRLRRAWLEPVRLGVVRSTDEMQDREIVALEDVPQHLLDAILIAEDRRYFDHSGIDPQRIAAAALANLKSGEITQGGSTLTQQLVKNLYVGRERSLARKLREAALSVLLERRRTKQAILEAYLNEIYLGQDGGLAIHGVARAARHYFGRELDELSVAQAAVLAAIIPGPVLYDPLRNPDLVRGRRDWVLRQLHEHGRIDDDALEVALRPALGLRPKRQTLTSAGYFTDHLRQTLEEAQASAEPADDGAAGDARWARPGHSLVTTLDWRLQAIAEKTVAAGLERLEERHPQLAADEAKPLQAALVALDPRSGEVLAMVGGRRYGGSQFNRATQATRQPGSVFKPIVALAALGRVGREPPRFTLASMLEDAPLMIPATEPDEEDWEPANHDAEFRGPVTLREAFEQSLNVPVARLAQEVGLRHIVRTARRLGLTSRLRAVPSLPLGTFEVTLLEITSVYGVLANGGVRAEPWPLLYTVDEGERALAPDVPEARRRLPSDEAYLINSLLRGVIDRGTARGLPAYGYQGPGVGKTGTTNDYRDAWFIGFTPELVVGVWVGFDDGTSIGRGGSEAAMPLFSWFMRDALGPRGGTPFPRPRGVERTHVIAVMNEPAGLRCDDEGSYEELFLRGSEPLSDCRYGLARVFFPHERHDRIENHEPRLHGDGYPYRVELPDVSSPPPRRRQGFRGFIDGIFGRR